MPVAMKAAGFFCTLRLSKKNACKKNICLFFVVEKFFYASCKRWY